MRAYMRRLLEPPYIIDLLLFSVIVAIASILTGTALFVMLSLGAGTIGPLLALAIVIVFLCYLISPVVRSWKAGLFIAFCVETVVVAISFLTSRTEHDYTWPAIATIATILAVAVFHERMGTGEKE